ncbi:MAG TPA: hypothetical protein VGD40_06055 [Chryseosolibacter sp.]
MRQVYLLFLTVAVLQGCAHREKIQDYPLQVGDITFNAGEDDPVFKVCNEDQVAQYYNFGKGVNYKGEKLKIVDHFQHGFRPSTKSDESGFITIRFIVNCHGETGRFRWQEMDENFNEKVFDEDIRGQLLDLTRQLDGWGISQYEGKAYDYYQYLTFKIESGKLVEIMP